MGDCQGRKTKQNKTEKPAVPEQGKMEKRSFHFKSEPPLRLEESTNTKLSALPRELRSVFQIGKILCNLTTRLTKAVKTELHFPNNS